MRQIARAVGIKATSLYHHFPDKQTLYIEALAQAFSKHADFLNESFILPAGSEQRLITPPPPGHRRVSGGCAAGG